MSEELVSLYNAATIAANYKAQAATILRRVGFREVGRSASCSSQYFRWAGRDGVLRLSDHHADWPDVVAELLLQAGSLPASRETFERMVATAIGRFFLATVVDTTVTPRPS